MINVHFTVKSSSCKYTSMFRALFISIFLTTCLRPLYSQSVIDRITVKCNESMTLWNDGHYEEAVDMLTVLYDDIREQTDVLSNTKMGVAYSIGDMLCQLGRHEQAAEYFEEAHEQWKKFGLTISKEKVDILGRLTKCLYDAKRYDEAEKWGGQWQRSVGRQYGKYSPQYLESVYLVGMARYHNKNYVEARNDFMEYLSLYDYNDEVDSTCSKLIMSYLQLSECHLNVLDYRAARESLETADSLSFVYNMDARIHAIIKQRLGTICIQYEEFDTALEYLNEASEIIENMDPALEDTVNLAFYLAVAQNIASTYVNCGNFDDAIEIYENLIDIYKDIGYTEKPIYGCTLANYAVCLDMAGETRAAIIEVFAADDVFTRIGYNRGEIYIVNKLYKLFCLLGMEDERALLDECSAFSSYATNQILSTFPYLTEKERAQFWNKVSLWYSYVLPNLVRDNPMPELVKMLYDGVLQSKGILLNSSLNIERMLRIADKESLYNLQRQRQRAIEIVNDSGQEVENVPVVYELERRLLKELMPYGNFMQDMNVNTDSIVHSLDDGEIAIEFVATENYDDDDTTYMAMTLRAGYDAPHFMVLFTQRDIDKLTAASAMTGLDGSLYELLWGKLENELKDISKIYFAADGSLYRIPVEYCETPDGRRMQDKYECCRISSTRELLHRRNRTAPPHDVTMYGDVDYDADYNEILASLSDIAGSKYVNRSSTSVIPSMLSETNRALTRDNRDIVSVFGRLKFTRDEIRAIDSLCTAKGISTVVLDSCRASEESAKNLSSPEVLHFATHGVYFTPQEMENLSYVQRLTSKADPLNESLLRSALILAGANNVILENYNPDMEDGFLTALDITSINLKGTDLVVLSACESGLGDISGDGVFGLQRGFKKAGARSLVMSLLSVNDYVANMFVSAFFDSYLADGDKQRALHHAQNVVRSADGGRWNKIEYWAPFVLLDGIK